MTPGENNLGTLGGLIQTVWRGIEDANGFFMHMRSWALAAFFSCAGCATSVVVDGEQPTTETVELPLRANVVEPCVVHYHLEGEGPFGGAPRVLALRMEADEYVTHVQTWLAATYDSEMGCPERADDDRLLFDGVPTTDVVLVEDDVVAGAGTAVVLKAEREGCGDDCPDGRLIVEFDLIAP